MRRLKMVLIIFWSVVALLLVGMLVRFSIAGVPSFTRTRGDGEYKLLLDYTASPAQIEKLRLDLGSDDVEVRLSEDADIHIRQYGVNLPEDRILQVSQNSGTLTLKRQPAVSFFNFSFFVDSGVEVYLPESYGKTLDIHLASGNLQFLDDFSLSQLDVSLASGDISSDGVLSAPNVNIDIASGTLDLADIRTDAYALSVASGDVSIGALSGSGKVSAMSGSIDLDCLTLDGSLYVQVMSGDVSIGIAKDASFEFSGKATSGSISTYFGVNSDGGPIKNLRATVGDAPSGSLEIDVTSGTVTIFEAD